MSRAVHRGKKLNAPPVSSQAADEVGIPNSSRLFITDTHSKTQYLIDTGSDVSILPAAHNEKQQRNASKFGGKSYAANGTQIDTFGQRNLVLDLGLRRKFQWPFIVADVTQTIIGADFLEYFGLLVDLRKRRLID